MKRKVKAITHDRVSPKATANGTKATTSTRRGRKIVISEQGELNGFKPTIMGKGGKLKQINREKTVNETLKTLQVKLSRCDEFLELKTSDATTNYSDELEDMKPMIQTGQKRSKIRIRKNIKKIDNATRNLKKDKDFDIGTALDIVADNNSNQVGEIKTKSKTVFKTVQQLKEHKKEMNMSKATEDVQTDKDFIKPNSKTTVKKLKNSKPEVSSKATDPAQKNEYKKTKSKGKKLKKLENSEENNKNFEDDFATEKDEDVELCDDSEVVESSKQEDEIKPKSKTSVKMSKNSIRTKKNTLSETSGNLKPNNILHDATKVQINMEKNEGIRKSFETLKCNDSELSVDVSEKVKNVPNATDKGGNKRKRGKQFEYTEDDDARPTKSAKKDKDAGKSKSSKEKIPDVTSIDFSNDSKTSSGNVWNFKISSWNVNGIRAWLEKNGLSYVHHENPDIICIQETKCSDEKLPDELREIEGYHTYWLSGDKDGYSGVGLISKLEPIGVKYGIGISEHDDEGRVITAEYDKFYLVAAYVPNAGRKLVRLEYRKKWDEDFRAYIKKLDAEKPVILCGDLNVAHEEIDLANPKTNKKNAGFTKEEREGFSALLKEGFTDTFRQLYPNVTGAYTFWTYMLNARAKNVGWRLDYFVVSERFCENLCDNVIRKDVFGSDHCPITLFLSL